jgi:flagellar protein FlgJ
MAYTGINFNRARMPARQGIIDPSRMGPPQIGVDGGSMRQGIVSAPTMREALMQTQPQQGVAEILSQGLPEMMPDLGGATSAASRQRQIADMLLQGAQSQDNTSIAGGLSQLGQAFLARKAGQKADTAEDKQREMASLLMQQAMQGGEQGQASLQQLLTQNPDAAMQYAIQANAPKPPPEAYTLGEGQRRYVGDQMIAEVPKPTEAPKYEKVTLADGEYEYIPGQPESLRKVGDSPVKPPLVDIRLPGEGPQETAFMRKAGEHEAGTFGALVEMGQTSRRNRVILDQLDTEAAAIPGGLEAVAKNALGNFGIPVEGLSEIQATEALINQLVPAQRQPGSGPMSDRDLALFKASLPRLIQTAEGKTRILTNMKAINDYVISEGEIGSRVLSGEITPEQGRAQMQALGNPLAGDPRTGKPTGPQGADLQGLMAPDGDPVTEEDVAETMRKYNVSREAVIAHLRGQ